MEEKVRRKSSNGGGLDWRRNRENTPKRQAAKQSGGRHRRIHPKPRAARQGTKSSNSHQTQTREARQRAERNAMKRRTTRSFKSPQALRTHTCKRSSPRCLHRWQEEQTPWGGGKAPRARPRLNGEVRGSQPSEGGRSAKGAGSPSQRRKRQPCDRQSTISLPSPRLNASPPLSSGN